MKPLHDYVLLQKVEAPKTSCGGILLVPFEKKDGVVEGIVVDCGPGLYSSDGTLIPLTDALTPGVKVLYKPFTGIELPDNHVLVSYRDILAVI